MKIVHKTYSQSQLESAYKKGLIAAQKGLHRMLNPYGIGTMSLFSQWEKGYDSLEELKDA